MPPEQRAPRARCHSIFRMPYKASVFCIYSKTAQNVPSEILRSLPQNHIPEKKSQAVHKVLSFTLELILGSQFLVHDHSQSGLITV